MEFTEGVLESIFATGRNINCKYIELSITDGFDYKNILDMYNISEDYFVGYTDKSPIVMVSGIKMNSNAVSFIKDNLEFKNMSRGGIMEKREAVRAFVNDFSFIERKLIECVCDNNIDNFVELTPYVYVGNEVNYIDNVTGNEEVGCISEIDEINNKIIINKKAINAEDVYAIYDGFLPIYSIFFSHKDFGVEDWIENNLEKVAKCGFRIYRYEETGSIYLGIDGCGYDFYKEHWEPLYDAIGLKWNNF